MLDRLQYVKQRFDEISDLIIQPDVIADQKRYVQLNQEYKSLKALVINAMNTLWFWAILMKQTKLLPMEVTPI
jgi:protein subunit release factor A